MPVRNVLDLANPNNRFDVVNFETVFQALASSMAEDVNIQTGTLAAGVPQTVISQANDERKTLIVRNTGAQDMTMQFSVTYAATQKSVTVPAYSSFIFESIIVGSVHGLSDDHQSIIEQYIIKCEYMGVLTLISTVGTTFEVVEVS